MRRCPPHSLGTPPLPLQTGRCTTWAAAPRLSTASLHPSLHALLHRATRAPPFGQAPRMGGLALVGSGDEALARLGLEHESSGRCRNALAALLTAELAAALVGLQLTRPRAQPMLPPPRVDERGTLS
eukprot:7382902-Prymnesium_polylepis.1